MKRLLSLSLLSLVACGVEPEGYEFDGSEEAADLEQADAEQLDRYTTCMDGEPPSIANTGASCWTQTYRCGKQGNGSFGCVPSGWVGPSTIWCVTNGECAADDLSDYTSVPGVGDHCQCGNGSPDPDGWTHENPYE